MKKDRLEAGQIVSTHGIHGEVRVYPWADGPEFFSGLPRLFIDDAQMKVLRARPHKTLSIIKLEGIDSVEAAMKLKGKTVYIDRSDVDIGDRFFVQDLIGLDVYDEESGEKIGKLADVLNLPAQDVYVVKNEKGREYMIPAVDEFLKSVDPDGGRITVRLISGM